ncbi:MAG: hypothetical protein ASARMPRED_001361 [Alectoria sarmentosa]|nr:MAG: hypothetical protein ASARMPRED_001361 [Alectoria sarmentosa]
MSNPSVFPPLHTIKPTSTSTHTIIALHGRGSQGPEFAEELFEGQTSAGKTLQEHLPSYKWVFPSSQERYSTVFQEEMDEWFDLYSLSNPSAREELQTEGLKDSVGFLQNLIRDEISLLDSDASRIILMGISQGCATALVAMLVRQRKLGGFIGFSGWMPFRAPIEEIGREGSEKPAIHAEETAAFFETTFGLEGPKPDVAVLGTRVLLGHAADDEVVDIGLSRRACAALEGLGMEVEWKEYRDGGHWISEPQDYDDIVAFLARGA